MGIDTPIDLKQAHMGVGGRLLYWEYIDRLRKSMKWNIPSAVHLMDKHPRGAVMICGAGPSIRDDVPRIREMQRQGGLVMTCNKTYEYLLDHGIVADYHVMLDPMPWVAEYVQRPHPMTKFLVSHQCDPAVARRLRLRGGRVYLWIAACDYYGATCPSEAQMAEYANRDFCMVAGSTTVGLRAVILAYYLGFRAIHLFGMDSSMVRDAPGAEPRLHVMPKDKPKDATEGTVTLNNKAGSWEFYTNNHMSKQATDFEDLISQIAERIKAKEMEPIGLRVYGEGLLPAFAASVNLHADEAMNRKYQGLA